MMSQVCRTCLEIFENGCQLFSVEFNSSGPDRIQIKTKLQACVPEIALHRVRNSVICRHCLHALNTAYDFKTKCLQAEAKMFKYLTEETIDSIELSSLIKNNNVFNCDNGQNIQGYRSSCMFMQGSQLPPRISFSPPFQPLPPLMPPVQVQQPQIPFPANPLPFSDRREEMYPPRPLHLRPYSSESEFQRQFRPSINLRLPEIPRPPDLEPPTPQMTPFSQPYMLHPRPPPLMDKPCYQPRYSDHMQRRLPPNFSLNNFQFGQPQFRPNMFLLKPPQAQENSLNSAMPIRIPEPHEQAQNALNCLETSVASIPNSLPFNGESLQEQVNNPNVRLEEQPLEQNRVQLGNNKEFVNKSSDSLLRQSLETAPKSQNEPRPMFGFVLTSEALQQSLRPPFTFRLQLAQQLQKKGLPFNFRFPFESPPRLNFENIFKCPTCQHGFTSHAVLKAHMKCHIGLKCNTCDFTTDSAQILDVHVKSHNTQEKQEEYKCSNCEYSTTNRDLFKQHRAVHVGPSHFCSLCSFRTCHYSSLRRHLKVHRGSRPFRCGECKFGAADEATLEAHMKTHQGTAFKCGQCPYISAKESDLNDHVSKFHKKESSVEDSVKPPPVLVSNPYFITIEQVHAILQGEVTEAEAEGGPVQEPLLVSMEEIQEILKEDDETDGQKSKKTFRCSVCSREYKFVFLLKRHMQVHAPGEPLQCPKCDFTATIKSHFQVHMKQHSGGKYYQCELCSYSTIYWSNMQKHKRVHTGEKPYKCPHCDYRASQQSTLKAHINIHNTILKCNQCSFVADTEVALDEHVQLHSFGGHFMEDGITNVIEDSIRRHFSMNDIGQTDSMKEPQDSTENQKLDDSVQSNPDYVNQTDNIENAQEEPPENENLNAESTENQNDNHLMEGGVSNSPKQTSLETQSDLTETNDFSKNSEIMENLTLDLFQDSLFDNDAPDSFNNLNNHADGQLSISENTQSNSLSTSSDIPEALCNFIEQVSDELTREICDRSFMDPSQNCSNSQSTVINKEISGFEEESLLSGTLKTAQSININNKEIANDFDLSTRGEV